MTDKQKNLIIRTITGVLFDCGGQPSVLGVDGTYDSYLWSNGATSATTTVGTGTYSVTVTKAGYTFALAPQVSGIVIGPNATAVNVNAVTP